MSKNTEIVKKIKREDGSGVIDYLDNGKFFTIARDTLGNMNVSLSYTSQDKTNNYQDFFEFEAGSAMGKAINMAFATCKEDVIIFDTTDGFLFLDRQNGTPRFVFMREFNEGTRAINLELARDENSCENKLMQTLFDYLPKDDRVSISIDNVELTMIRKKTKIVVNQVMQEFQSINFSINDKGGKQIDRTDLVVKRDNKLYDMIMSSFISFGGYAEFDMCNGSLILQQRIGADGKEEFVFSYDKGNNNDPSNGKEYYTMIYDNTIENQALFNFYSLLENDRRAPLGKKQEDFYIKAMRRAA